MFKSGFVSIVGKPNVGKSTFLNQVLKTKLVITSPKPQTTRNTITGIYTSDESQIIFLDTPGIHKAKNKLDEYMSKMAYNALDIVDLVLFMINGYDEINEEDKEIIRAIKNTGTQVFLIINKVDLIKDIERLERQIAGYKNEHDFDGIFAISAKEGTNVDLLIKDIENVLEEGPMYYPEDQITDKPERFIVQELVREKILNLTHNEVPHSVMVEVETFKKSTTSRGVFNISCVIVCEREGQKRIIVGHNGAMIKKIGQEARKEIERFMGVRVYLELFCKVEKDWRNREYYLKSFGYKEEFEE